MSKFSIILPVRNGGDYLKECVNSILAQTHRDFHLHVLDNCSTDKTPEWIQGLQQEKISVYPADRPLTITENWGRIVQIPKNEFMTMIGHDDLLHPDYLLEMNALIEKHPGASLYQAHYNYIDGSGRFIRPCKPMDEVQYAHEFLACQMAQTLDSMGTGYMMRSADYNAIGGMPAHYPNLIFADYEMLVNLMKISYKATTVKTTFSYRLHLSVSRTTNGMLYQDAFGRYVAFIKTLMVNDPAMQLVVARYGKQMLMYFCESLSHRLLKTPFKDRTMKVKDYVNLCKQYASMIIPGQPFDPMKMFRIRIASDLDQTAAGRGLFRILKKFTGVGL